MEVAGANRRWPFQFRLRGSRRESAVAQLSTLGHETYDCFGTIKSFESSSVYAGADSILEHEVLGAAITSSLRKIQHRLFLPSFDGGCSDSELAVMA